uniref:Uncharacterized protein n=1 Tax=Rhizophora mucronata TaxID=61149 RepID=A0A2P2N495_RHIMU
MAWDKGELSLGNQVESGRTCEKGLVKVKIIVRWLCYLPVEFQLIVDRNCMES